MHHWPRILRVLLGIVFVAHGIAHLVGAQALFGLSDPNDPEMQLPDPALEVLNTGALGMAFGVVWVIACVGFVVVGARLWRGDDIDAATLLVTLVSLALCFLAWPAAPIGIGVNAAILAVLAVAWVMGRRSTEVTAG